MLIARALVGEAGREVESLLRRAHPGDNRWIGPTAATLLDQTLRRGVVLELCRRGGWRDEPSLSANRVLRGRLWDRHESLPLVFSEWSFEFLRWLRDQDLSEPEEPLDGFPKTGGDELLCYLALDLLEASDQALEQAAFRASPLCWLGHFRKLSHHGAVPKDLDFDALHPVLIEGLQADLTRKWLAAERAKASITRLDLMCTLGQAQQAVLDPFLDAVDRKGRRDLATFVVDVGVALVRPPTLLAQPPPGLTYRYWIGALDRSVTLAERQAAFAAAGSFLRVLGRIGRWSQEHGATAHFDDEYEGAQMLLSRWGCLGTIGFARAHRLARDLESLHTLGRMS